MLTWISSLWFHYFEIVSKNMVFAVLAVFHFSVLFPHGIRILEPIVNPVCNHCGLEKRIFLLVCRIFYCMHVLRDQQCTDSVLVLGSISFHELELC